MDYECTAVLRRNHQLQLHALHLAPTHPCDASFPPPPQVAISCLERGFLIHQLWQALRYFLRAALADRDLAWSVARDARMREHALADAVAAATAQLRSEKDEATRINEALNKRLVMRQAEAEKQKHKVSEVRRVKGQRKHHRWLRRQQGTCSTCGTLHTPCVGALGTRFC